MQNPPLQVKLNEDEVPILPYNFFKEKSYLQLIDINCICWCAIHTKQI